MLKANTLAGCDFGGTGWMARSRLIVLSLPSKLTTEELTAHFKSLELPITDAKVLFKPDGQSRRLGFVGFGTADHAGQAKDWFDGTWLHGSRIKVDYAKEVRIRCSAYQFDLNLWLRN